MRLCICIYYFLKTYIWSWRICTYGLKNMILYTYVRNTYDLKNTVCQRGWTTTNECQWMEGAERTEPDGRTSNESWRTSDRMMTNGDKQQHWRNYDRWRWMVDDDRWWMEMDGVWRRMATTTDGNYNGWRLQWTMMVTMMATMTTMMLQSDSHL